MAIVPVTAPPTPVYQIRQLQKAEIPVVFCHRARRRDPGSAAGDPVPRGRATGRAGLGRTRPPPGRLLRPHLSESAVGYLEGLLDVLPPGG